MFAIFTALSGLLLSITMLVGWVLNIIALAGAPAIAGFEVVRIAGIIVAPLGAVLGFFF